ncbi:hypothetical protein N9582_00100 [Amylibacter sp.]|nr:hypothetical protein [Amylibacter sp.]
MKKLLLASASVLTLISACTKEVEVADRAGILQKFSGSDDEVQDIGIERLTTTLPQEVGGQTIVANVMREGISEELPAGDIEGIGGIEDYVVAFAGIAEAMITGGDTTQIGEGMGAFIIPDTAMITSDSDAENIIGAIYTQGSDEDMVGVAIVPGINEVGIMVFAAGTEVSNIPTAGEFSYEGSNFMTNLGEDEIDGDYGSFNATVDFAAGTGAIISEFENIPIAIDGDFTVDTNTGTFVGEKVGLFSMFENYDNSTVTIHGNFHGDGATGMTGIYTQNVEEPDFIGAIAGTQVLDVVD